MKCEKLEKCMKEESEKMKYEKNMKIENDYFNVKFTLKFCFESFNFKTIKLNTKE